MRLKQKLLLIALLAIAFAGTVSAWEVVYGGDMSDIPYGIAATSDGGFVVVGRTASFGEENGDIYLLRTDINGDTLWTRTYGDTMNDVGCSVVERPEGGFVIVGFSAKPGGNTPLQLTGYWSGNLFIIATDDLGNITDSLHLGGTPNSLALRSVAHTDDSCYVAIGGESSFIGDSWIYYVKFSIYADEIETLWTRRHGDGLTMFGNSIIQSESGDYLSTGCYGSFPTAMFISRITSIGDLLWLRTDFMGEGLDTCSDSTDTIFYPRAGYSIVETPESDIVVLSASSDSYNSNRGNMVIRTDSEGDTVWTAKYGSDSSRCLSMTKAQYSGFLLTGYSPNAGNDDFWLLKINDEGDSLWSTLLGETVGESGMDIIKRPDEGYVLCGYRAYSESDTDIVIIAVDSLGEDLRLEVVEEIPRPLDMAISAWPNPFNSAVTISVPEGWEVEIIDIKGRQVETLGGGKRTWRPKATLGSGIYLLQAKIGDGQTVTKRVVYMK